MSSKHHTKIIWFKPIKAAISSHLLFKCIGITLLISLFFIAYFYVLNHPAYPPSTIPLTFIDQVISFQPWALPIYLSLWVYVAIPPVLMKEYNELYAFALSIGLMSITGLTIFYCWPTTLPVSEIDWRLYSNIQLLKRVDATGNACPSMHVATAVFSCAWLANILREIKAPSWLNAINIIWCVGIVYSTVATRQHVTLDVLGGLILASVAILLTQFFYSDKQQFEP